MAALAESAEVSEAKEGVIAALHSEVLGLEATVESHKERMAAVRTGCFTHLIDCSLSHTPAPLNPLATARS